MPALPSLRTLLDRLPATLKAIPEDRAAHRSSPMSWSVKEELGHLLDSAANNHQRIVRVQLEDRPAMPSYDGDAWVALHHYQERSWPEVIETWRYLNQQILAAAEAASTAAWGRTLTIGDSKPLTLEFVFDDYLDHMLQHLHHMGIEAKDLGLT